MFLDVDTPFLRHTLAGALAGAFNDLIMHPADTLRAKINATTATTTSPYSALVNTFRSTLQTQGVRGFYRGYSSVLLFSMPGNGIYFSTYELSKATLQSSAWPSHVIEPLSGLNAQFAVSFLWTPYDIVKQRMQTSTTASTLRNEFQLLLRSGELFRGLTASWIVWAPFSIVYFGIFESSRRTLSTRLQSDWKLDLISGTIAGVASAIVSQPADAVKTRLQVLQGDDFMANGFWRGARDIVRKEGSSALWRGVVARVCWLAPGCALTITAFEAMKGIGYEGEE